jgi:hypothetical protein
LNLKLSCRVPRSGAIGRAIHCISIRICFFRMQS